MSADTEIAILETIAFAPKMTKEYRIAKTSVSMMENLEYSDLFMPVIFGDSPVFESVKEAETFAATIAIGEYIEHGIHTYLTDRFYPKIDPALCAQALGIDHAD